MNNHLFDPEIVLNIWRRKGADSQYLKAFGNLPSEAKEYLLQQVSLINGEVPIVAYWFNDTDWFLLTNYRLSWCDDQGEDEVFLSEITQTETRFSVSNGHPLFFRLDITTSTRTTGVFLEFGTAYSGLSSILLWASSRTISKLPTQSE